MERPRWRRVALLTTGFAASIAGPITTRTCVAQAQAQAARTPSPAEGRISQALQATRSTGQPTLVVVTSRNVPATGVFWSSLVALRPDHPLPRAAHVVELPIEEASGIARGMGVVQPSSLVLYARDASGLVVAGKHTGELNIQFASRWIDLLTPRATSPNPDPALIRTAGPESSEPGVTKANFRQASAQDYPSEQRMPAPPPQAPQPPPSYQPPPAYYPPPVYGPAPTPIYSAPAAAPVVISPPQAPIVVQPSAPTVIVGPVPQPNILFAMAPTPTVTYAPQPASAPPAYAPPNLLGPPASAPPASAPPANAPPAYAPPAYAPPAYAPPAYASVAYAPPAYAPPAAAPPAYAPVAQAPVATAPATMMLTNPNLFNRMLGTLGEHLAEKKNPRVRMGSAPAMAPIPLAAAPMGYGPAMGYAPVAPPGYALVPIPANGEPGHAPQDQGHGQRRMYAPVPQPDYEPPNAPSPQSPKKSGFFSGLRH